MDAIPAEYMRWIGTAGLFTVAVLWAVWRAGQWLLQREQAWTDPLNAVMAATVLRRDRPQTLSAVLEKTVEVLGAVSGSLHMHCEDGDAYQLVHAVNVVRLDWLAAVPIDDPASRWFSRTGAPVLIEGTHVNSRWAALTKERGAGLVGMRLGTQMLMALAWPSRRAAEHHLPALQAIQRYAEQVLGEFDELEARAAEIQALSASLSRHERLARTASHDLSNKLAAAQSLLELALESQAAQGEAAEWLQQAADQIRLSRPLLEELSDPEREIEREALQVEPLAQLAAVMLARRRRQRDVTFALEIAPNLPAIWGERLAVLRVLDNLLSNALKHNVQQPGLRVWLRIWAEAGQVVFEVGDNGVGIAPEAQSELFEFGFRVDSTGKVKGHGLGLWSSRRLVEALGGRIWAESEPGQATRFCFVLPAVNEAASGTVNNRQAEPAGELLAC